MATSAQAAILAATEELLAERSLSDLSVARILQRAGVSRTTFYTHYPSKNAVVAACFRQFMDEVLVAVDPFLAGPAADPEAVIRASLRGWVATCLEHRGLVRAVSEEWPHDDELRRLWWGRLERGARDIAATIVADRATGAAPQGADAVALASCLIWAFERVVHVALAGGAHGLPDAESTVEPLVQLLVGGVYGRPLASPAPVFRVE
ncbi:HTH-type transcriptional regulator EthR [Paraconexibacter sp. AEG42_29]|uniref:HTH-type transcriptional regulator EthR n=1 Tax=Paraconexibacter sp. AEG42_29 TaxID=2997339 RepID=A0AAU7B243_9ACTN